MSDETVLMIEITNSFRINADGDGAIGKIEDTNGVGHLNLDGRKGPVHAEFPKIINP
jgi:hypothetical protein